jgi:hypothetical protein
VAEPDWMDDPEAQAWARRVLDDLVPKLDGSAFTVSLIPTGPADVKFAVELGMTIMLDKPIIAVVQTGTQIPEHLARVADEIVEMDDYLDKSSQRRLRAAIGRVTARLDGE